MIERTLRGSRLGRLRSLSIRARGMLLDARNDEMWAAIHIWRTGEHGQAQLEVAVTAPVEMSKAIDVERWHRAWVQSCRFASSHHDEVDRQGEIIRAAEEDGEDEEVDNLMALL
jgi:hypothetical protein